jgi:hypothetical protein
MVIIFYSGIWSLSVRCSYGHTFLCICLLVSGNESDNESENSTEDDAESIQSNEADIGLKSLLDDDNQDDDEMNIKKVCRTVWCLSKDY